MADCVVHRGTTARLGRIEGKLRVGNRARIEASQANLVSVTGEASFEGSAEIHCDFECASLKVERGGVLKVFGDLTVHKLLDVVHSIEAKGGIRAGEIDVGGRVRAKSIVSSDRIRVGGILEVSDLLEARSVEVAGKVLVPGSVKLVDLGVGGVAEIGGGTISGNIRIGGKFEVRSPLEFGALQVFGHTSLPSKSHGVKISTFGRLSGEGDLDCDEIDVQGVSQIRGNCKSKKIHVKGKLEIGKNLEAEEVHVDYGTAEIQGDVRGTSLKIAGKFRARSAIASGEFDIVGFAETLAGIKGAHVTVESGSRCAGPLVGERVYIGKSSKVLFNVEKKWAGQVAALRLVGKMTRVEDIYAKYVHLGRVSTSRKVFAEVVEIEDGTIADEIQYSVELKGDLQRTHIEKGPEKVERLPPPPL